MQNTNKHGAKPGKDTPIKKVTGGDKTTTATTQFATLIIAIRAKLEKAISGICLDLGIGLESLVMLALVAAWIVWGVL